VLKRVLIDEAIEVLFQLARDFRRSTRAWAVGEALRALVGKAMDPRKRNRFMCSYSVAERCSFQSGNSKEGPRWGTSRKPH
jgi:hypothetical protein